MNDDHVTSGNLERIATECYARRVNLLSRSIGGVYNEALRPLEMTAAQLTLLVAIARTGPVAPGVIATRLGIEKSTMSRNVNLMKKRGWIAIAHEAARPGRSHSLVIESKGRALVERAVPLWEQAQAETRELLGEPGALALLDAAKRVNVGMAPR